MCSRRLRLLWSIVWYCNPEIRDEQFQLLKHTIYWNSLGIEYYFEEEGSINIMGDRYFSNTLSDFVESTTHADEDGDATAITKDPQKSLELPMSEMQNLLKAAIALKDEVESEWLASCLWV